MWSSNKKINIKFKYWIKTWCLIKLKKGIKIVKTKAGNSVLISLLNGEGWLLKSDTNNFKIEKNIFFGNKNKIINNESISILGNLNDEIISINWEIEKVN